MTVQARIRAPERGAGGWIGTGGRELTLAGLRGKVVLLDVWTSCCVNCLHVLDELRPLEQRFADVLVVVGVHSPSRTRPSTRSSSTRSSATGSTTRCWTTRS